MTPATLAIVDDDPQFVEYMSTLLRSRGYVVQTFNSGPALLRALNTETPPQVVLLDVLMPELDGLETLKALRTSHPGVPVIMLSGRQTPATIVDAVRLGAADYVVKPDDPEGLGEAALEAAVRSAVEKLVLKNEIARMRERVNEDPDGAPIWGPSLGMRQVMTMIDRIADSDVTVLISGESGVGKELIARELHRRSARSPKPFVKINCAALPAELLESELFGHEKGAFTGAQATRVGKFEFANGGTLMLDEISEMPLALQAKLLHVLQDSEFTKLGSNRQIAVDVRVLAATNRNLGEMITRQAFREDLYYRLQVIEVHVPPLRERREEIPLLTEYFLQRYAERYGRPLRRPSPVLDNLLSTHPWPGNVRELENIIKRLVILQDEALVLSELQRTHTPAPSAPIAAPSSPPPVETAPAAVSAPAATESAAAPADTDELAPGSNGSSLPELAREAAMRAERSAIQIALDRFHWNRRKAAQHLGVSYKTLLNKMKECGIAEAKM
ncbi:MAG: sigma-54-dependent transcriptional regulator [Acidobacteriota bacterium]